MSLYLHNIWIHWPNDFEKIEFDQEATDCHEAWLAKAKRILNFTTDRNPENALVELIIRIYMEDLTNESKPENKYDRIGKYFENYKWNEYIIPPNQISPFLNDWTAFIKRITSKGFVLGKDFKVNILPNTKSWQIEFKTV